MTDTLGRETFRDFCGLTFEEVSQRAEAVRAEIEEGLRLGRIAAADGSYDDAAWLPLHRSMSRARAAKVSDLAVDEVERFAYQLGYGTFRLSWGGPERFMPGARAY
jgi:hypothetical protein